MTRSIKLFCFAALCCYGATAVAQSFQPSPAQIEQFKSMSPQQQRQLAESMGIDIDSLIGQQGQQSSSIGESPNNEPRGRQQQGQNGYPPTGMQGMQQGLSPFAMPLTLEEIAALQEEYRNLPQEEFDAKFERNYGHLSRVDFLDLYQQVTGREFSDRKQLKPFGYDLFNLAPDAFAPPIDSPVPADYVMGPGDTLVIQLYGKENSTHYLDVSRDGQVQFPGIGPLNIAGLTFSQAQNVIANTVNEQMIGVKSSITMGALRTIRVFVLGEATQPGSYTVSSLSTMTNALFASGGVTKVGSLRNIQLKRKGKTVTTLDVYDLLLNGDTRRDERLLPGDVIFIPPVGSTVAVKGEVKRPAIYELKGEVSAAEVIDLAGGTTSKAYREITRLQRVNSAGEGSLIPLDLTSASGRNFRVQNADSLEVGSVLDELEDAITLEGHVKRPGNYAWRENYRFSDLVNSVENLKNNPDLNVALIKRQIKKSKQTTIRVFSPKAAWAEPGSDADPVLEKGDTVFMFDYETDRSEALEEILKDLQIQSRYQEREKIVSVVGSVRFPGDYPLADGMTAEELINLAGGLTESALATEGELTRYEVNDELQRVVVHLPVNLEDAETRLQPADTLRIKRIPLWQEKETVEISGEISFPGTYTIVPGETLIQLIERAGGLTRHAYPRGAIFSRAELRELERERLMDLREKLEADLVAANLQEAKGMASVNQQEADRLLQNLGNVEAVGRMVIELPTILSEPAAYDFSLEDGDTLTIPRYKPSVTVVGEVQYPTSHFFDNKLDVQEYIARSGGTSVNADTNRIYIVKANGQVVLPHKSGWFKRNTTTGVQPGDTIVVPVDTTRVDRLTIWSSVTQIMYQAALGIAAISSL